PWYWRMLKPNKIAKVIKEAEQKPKPFHAIDAWPSAARVLELLLTVIEDDRQQFTPSNAMLEGDFMTLDPGGHRSNMAPQEDAS
ncbi:hypothetical protein HK101_005808, partial [Irineochytrium annulatum]